MIDRLTQYIGPARLRAIFLLLAITGVISLILNAVEAEWVTLVQSLLVLVFALGTVAILWGRIEPFDRGRILGLALPSIGAVLLGLLVVPQYLLALTGAAVGWIVAGLFIFRPRAPMAYQAAVKHLRKSEFADAVRVMDGVIRDDPRNPQHYRFRAEILRVWGKLDRARRDYQQMVSLAPDSAVAYNGLAEVNLQIGDYEQALDAANAAYRLAPDEWVTAYNLGMIEDRLARASDAIGHLQRALALKVPDARHRLLIHLYLARAHTRLGDQAAAEAAVDAMRREKGGLKEWQTIMGSEQAATLRAALGDDIADAEALVNGTRPVGALGGSGS